MFRKVMRAKIHRATVTQCVPDYVGSITIDANLLDAVDIRPNEAVHVLDIDNANRFETYVFRGEPGSGIIAVNGAAAKLVENGHKIIIVSYDTVAKHRNSHTNIDHRWEKIIAIIISSTLIFTQVSSIFHIFGGETQGSGDSGCQVGAIPEAAQIDTSSRIFTFLFH